VVVTTEKQQPNPAAHRAKRGSTRTDRVDLRIDPAIKQRWQHAADLLGVHLASFIKMATAERAEQTIRDQEMLVLTPEESEWFINYLTHKTWEPSPSLRRAAQLHRELFGDNPT
jgi:uncharacterized protein (DUF1778 family)